MVVGFYLMSKFEVAAGVPWLLDKFGLWRFFEKGSL
jgi:hypothetical protein